MARKGIRHLKELGVQSSDLVSAARLIWGFSLEPEVTKGGSFQAKVHYTSD